MKKKLLEMNIDDKLHTTRGFIVRCSPTHWRVIVLNPKPKWAHTFVLVNGKFVKLL